jgi:2',3'-cyclic-nucleotide 2'-phosphodiesterase/3'-nucleotidase
VPWARVSGQLVTQAGRSGEDLGRIEFRLKRTGERGPWAVMDARATVTAVSDSVPEDSTLASLAAPYHEAARAALDSLAGSTARPLTAPLGRFGDGSLWRLIQHAQLAATGADLSLAALPDPAAEIPAGPITRRMLMRLYPYENTLGVVLLSGAEVKQVLEKSASLLAAYTFEADRPLFEPDGPAYNFDAMAGVGYRLDLTRPAGDRVVDLTWHGSPISPEQRFKVAVNSYREFGGGGYPAIPAAPRLWQTMRGVRELIADYCAGPESLETAEHPRWSISPAQAVLPERGLLDLLVRRGVLATSQADSLDADRVVDRGTFATWLAHLMGPRAAAALPAAKHVRPDQPITAAEALQAGEKAARDARYWLDGRSSDASFRRSLLTGTSLRESDSTMTTVQALGVLANLRYPTLRLLETTDFHGAILTSTRDRATDRMIGGSPALAGWIERLRAENPEGTVLLDGGDCYQGTMISNLQFGRPVVEQMNALGYTATAIGNHEFDWTADTLVHRIVTLRCASLAANMVERRNDRRPRWARADTVVTRRGFRIGVLGLAYRETPTVTLPQNVAALRFDDDSTTAARLVPGLRKRADVVVGLGHVPAETDSTRHVHGDLWRDAQVPGFDVWFGGHSHNRVLDWAGDVPLMIAGAHGEVVGVCDVVVDGLTRRAVERRPRLQLTFDDAIAPDSLWVARIARWNADIAPIAGQILCRSARRLGRERGGESLIGSLVADAMRAEARVDVAMQNSGGLRADLPEGDVTVGAIYEVMPFDNTLFTLDLTADQIRQVLEEGLANGRVTQVSGIRYWFDTTRPRGDRVTLLAEANGHPLDPTFHYRVVVNNFMATGGDNYDTLMKGRHREDTGINVRDALERYVVARAAENGGVLDYRGDERVRRNERASAGR